MPAVSIIGWIVCVGSSLVITIQAWSFLSLGFVVSYKLRISRPKNKEQSYWLENTQKSFKIKRDWNYSKNFVFGHF